jgi:hypothetical protein
MPKGEWSFGMMIQVSEKQPLLSGAFEQLLERSASLEESNSGWPKTPVAFWENAGPGSRP